MTKLDLTRFQMKVVEILLVHLVIVGKTVTKMMSNISDIQIRSLNCVTYTLSLRKIHRR